jgi:cyclopropane-fatty-acyl-phospholipid synthase
LAVVLWNGEEFAAHAPPEGKIYFADRATLWKLALDPLFQFGEAYTSERIKVEGDLAQLLVAINHGLHSSPAGGRWMQWLHWPRTNSLSGSRRNIQHHYDLGNDFYRLWLDEQLVYTCAYFPEPAASLSAAQVAKFDHICRKLRLRAGEAVVEAGCGWGAFALHMARHYQVRVKAFNISREQLAFARERAQAEGLSDQVEFIDGDWRQIDAPCDAFVSVGMLEHVGVRNYRQLGQVMHRCLAPHGRGLIHSIGQNQAHLLNPWIERNIFPGAYPPTIRECMAMFEPCDFTVVDVENLRLHYAQTLRHWLARFEKSAETVRQKWGEAFVRMWRLYLSGSIAAFEAGSLQLFQILFTRRANNDLDWTRAAWYPERQAGEATTGS